MPSNQWKTILLLLSHSRTASIALLFRKLSFARSYFLCRNCKCISDINTIIVFIFINNKTFAEYLNPMDFNVKSFVWLHLNWLDNEYNKTFLLKWHYSKNRAITTKITHSNCTYKFIDFKTISYKFIQGSEESICNEKNNIIQE